MPPRACHRPESGFFNGVTTCVGKKPVREEYDPLEYTTQGESITLDQYDTQQMEWLRKE